MDEYYLKYAKPLGKLSMYDLRINLNIWRDNLKDELEGILYLRNGLNVSNPGINNNANSKIIIVCKKKTIFLKKQLFKKSEKIFL